MSDVLAVAMEGLGAGESFEALLGVRRLSALRAVRPASRGWVVLVDLFEVNEKDGEEPAEGPRFRHFETYALADPLVRLPGVRSAVLRGRAADRLRATIERGTVGATGWSPPSGLDEPEEFEQIALDGLGEPLSGRWERLPPAVRPTAHPAVPPPAPVVPHPAVEAAASAAADAEAVELLSQLVAGQRVALFVLDTALRGLPGAAEGDRCHRNLRRRLTREGHCHGAFLYRHAPAGSPRSAAVAGYVLREYDSAGAAPDLVLDLLQTAPHYDVAFVVGDVRGLDRTAEYLRAHGKRIYRVAEGGPVDSMDTPRLPLRTLLDA